MDESDVSNLVDRFKNKAGGIDVMFPDVQLDCSSVFTP